MNEIRQEIHRDEEYLLAFRREQHRHPELSLHEFETTERIVRELERLGIDVRRMEPTGVSGEIRGTAGPGGKTILIREDIDALPTTEHTGLAFASENEGCMHACGHDLHMGMLLGAVRYLKKHEKDFAGTVRFLFQPAEESSQGAKLMIAQGIMEGVDHVVGMHISPIYPAGSVSALPGECWAACDRFRIHVTGKSCHGAMPHTGKDAALCAAAIVMNLQQIVSREADPNTAAVVTVGRIQSGTTYNIVAGEAELEGTCRSFSEELHAQLPEKMRRIAEGTAAVYGCEATLEYASLSDVLYSDPEVTKLGLAAAEKVAGKENVFISPRQMIAEDFCYYAQMVPSVFFNIGARWAEDEKVRPLHSDEVLFDEGAVELGASVFVQTALDLLAGGCPGKEVR
ncbi:MAG: amidohydrolase [Lachnospiraceae bacterium]|nr:amidohydrolase [Lachnospiraceae bacterium]